MNDFVLKAGTSFPARPAFSYFYNSLLKVGCQENQKEYFNYTGRQITAVKNSDCTSVSSVFNKISNFSRLTLPAFPYSNF